MKIALVLPVVATLLTACTSSNDAPAGGGDAGVETAPSSDPFCRTRPRLDFCEDFDEGDLPGRFAGIEGDPAIVLRSTKADAPSPPFVLDVAHTPASSDVRLVFAGGTGVKYNLFFFVKVEPGHGRIDLAGLRDGDYELTLGLEEDDRWYVEERAAGSAPNHRTSDVKPTLATFWSVRFDVYVDGDGRGHLRFRSGADTVFLAEPLAFGGNKQTLTPHFYVGARLHGGAPARLSFDNIAVGEE